MPRFRKTLTQDEIEKILFNDTDESDQDLSDEEENLEKIKTSRELGNDSIISDGESENEGEKDHIEENATNGLVEWDSEDVHNEHICMPKFKHFSGPVHNLPPGSSALQYLKLFMTDEICDNIRTNTNKYAEYCAKVRGCKDDSWQPIFFIKELWAFFTILFVMSVNHLPRISDYWSKNEALGNERVKKMMTKNRFLKIKHNFHISDRVYELKKDDDNFNFTQKVESLHSYLRQKFTDHFKPSAEISVDETLVKFQGSFGNYSVHASETRKKRTQNLDALLIPFRLYPKL